MLSVSIVFVILTLAFIAVFLCCLPNPVSCRLPRRGLSGNRAGEKPVLFLITGLYAATAFLNLGNMHSPQSFVDMAGGEAVCVFTDSAQPTRMLLFPGVGQGEYSIEVSDNREGWFPVTNFTQDHVAVLKWQYIPLTISEPWRYLRIVCTYGNPWLGEVLLEDAAGERIPFTCTFSALTDEPEMAPEESNYHNSSYFDEIYHARTAWEHLHRVWPYEISHPPLGKEILSLGILLFGMTPFGWRFSGTLTGILMLPVMYLLLKRLFGGRRIPLLGTVLLASGFMHYAQTRIATIDSYAVFFILLMYYYMLGWLQTGRKRELALSGVFFGIGAACKWTCLYAGAGLGVLWLLHWFFLWREEQADRREALSAQNDEEIPEPFTEEKHFAVRFLNNILFCLIFFVAVPSLIYYLSYLPYGLAENCRPFSGAYTKLVLDNQRFMFTYHAGVVAEHPYSSRWYQWLFDIRPILYYLQYYSDGTRVSIAAFVNPLICWTGIFGILLLIFLALFRKDRTAGFIVIGWLSGVLPWVFISRLTFEYHYFAASVFLVPTICYLFSLIESHRRQSGLIEYGFTAYALMLFLLFFPVLNGIPIDNELGTKLLGWLPSWPI